jgi:hypothetical protein
MPADFLSRNILSIDATTTSLAKEQDKDKLTFAIKNYLLHQTLPNDETCKNLVKFYADDCFMDSNVLWKRIRHENRAVIFLPISLIDETLKNAHGHILSGHDGILKTKYRIMQSYFWPGMDANIASHIKTCHKCQVRKKQPQPQPTVLTPFPQPTEPNQRIHADLFGPLKTETSKTFILCITDAFTKYVELVPIETKDAHTVATAIFNKWICRYGSPIEIITDQGKEFCNTILNTLLDLCDSKHSRTSPHHPACNSQAEVANKTIAKFLQSFVDESTLDWEDYLYPLMFTYNTSFHRSILNTPFFLTHGIEPRHPNFNETDIRRKFYGDYNPELMLQRLLKTRDIARHANDISTTHSHAFYNKSASQHKYKINDLVLLNDNSFLHKNAKLAPKYTGPHRIVELKNNSNVVILTINNKKMLVHVDRLKPYHSPDDNNPVLRAAIPFTANDDIQNNDSDSNKTIVDDPTTQTPLNSHHQPQITPPQSQKRGRPTNAEAAAKLLPPDKIITPPNNDRYPLRSRMPHVNKISNRTYIYTFPKSWSQQMIKNFMATGDIFEFADYTAHNSSPIHAESPQNQIPPPFDDHHYPPLIP